MTDDPNSPDGPTVPVSLLPYETWLEQAHRDVMLKALSHAQHEGLPGEHHFYLTFRTDLPGVEIPAHLRERYPREMTIVLQHQFRDLKVDPAQQHVSVGLAFGGIPTTLVIPFSAITAFADPAIQLMLQFRLPEGQDNSKVEAGGKDLPTEAAQEATISDFPPEAARERNSGSDHESAAPGERKEAEVVSLAAFRRKPAGRETEARNPDPHNNGE
ncbi:SspB family protein [Oecophyllibacter saccharovorans]|uniref:SspB family protein n=1 Tax=Oecophyllibacter saccharovorans TaxID=2558360 RepID=UPI00116F91C0|nr:ClpXP protease specificity-enhancing factor SspB [Oecophyllibacter saccharovorans]TPW36303.1 hypothetical protein E3203_00420 [Oecophyllibacter saccharovorans]